MRLMETCDKCLRETPVEFMTAIEDVSRACKGLAVSHGVMKISQTNSRTDDCVQLCDFCIVECQQCGMVFLPDEGLIVCELDDEGFLTGDETALCPVCYSIEQMDAKVEYDQNTKWRPCLSNTTNSFKNDAFGRLDSENEASNEQPE